MDSGCSVSVRFTSRLLAVATYNLSHLLTSKPAVFTRLPKPPPPLSYSVEFACIRHASTLPRTHPSPSHAIALHSIAKLLVLHRMVDFATRNLPPPYRQRALLGVRCVLALAIATNSVGVVSNAVCSAFSVQLVSLLRALANAQAQGDAF